MSAENKILKLGVVEACCFNCGNNLNIGESSEEELKLFNKIYFRCSSCEYFSKISILGNGKIVIRSA